MIQSIFILYLFSFYILAQAGPEFPILWCQSPNTRITGMGHHAWLFDFLVKHLETFLVDLPSIT